MNTELASLKNNLENKFSRTQLELGKVSNLVSALDAKVSGAKKATERLKHFPKVNLKKRNQAGNLKVIPGIPKNCTTKSEKG